MARHGEGAKAADSVAANLADAISQIADLLRKAAGHDLRGDGRADASGVNVVIEPILGGDRPPRLVVALQDGGRLAARPAAPVTGPADDDRVRRLEAELQMARDLLQARDAELKSAREELQTLNGDLKILLQRRVRNILAAVRSLVARTLRTSDNLDDFASHLDGRLETLARTQGVVTRSAEGGIDLEELVRDEMLAVAAREEQLEIAGPLVELRPDAGETFALALHELATNAVKYGALSTPNGRISVTWRIFNTSAGPRLSLEWRESGVPALDTSPTRSGFGRELIERGLPAELGAATSLEFARGGVLAILELPLDGGASAQMVPLERGRMKP
jgi:two-component sensor histidine kinase